jgi:hypothetical protein
VPRATAFLLLLLVVASCARGHDATVATSVPVRPAPPLVTTTSIAAEPPPELVRTGDDFVAIVTSFVDYLEWVSGSPTLAGLDRVFVEGSPGDRTMRTALERYVAEGWRAIGEPGRVREARVQRLVSDDHVLVYAVVTSPAYDVVDREGAVIEHHEALPDHGWVFDLVRGGDGWLLQDRTVVGPA